MERVAAADTRIVGLTALLCHPRPGAVEVVPDSVPDPRAVLELERTRALEAGRQQGYAEGMARAEGEIRAEVEKAQQQVEAMHASETAQLHSANERLMALLRELPDIVAAAETRMSAVTIEAAYAAVLRLLGAADTDRALIARVCLQALDEYRQRPVVLRVSADDAPALSGLVEDTSVRIETDMRLTAGQCRLDTHKGLYDTSLDVRLEALKQAFLRGLANTEASA